MANLAKFEVSVGWTSEPKKVKAEIQSCNLRDLGGCRGYVFGHVLSRELRRDSKHSGKASVHTKELEEKSS